MLEFSSAFVFTLINLIVLVLLLRKFLFTPVTRIMEERQTMIQNSLDDAQRRQEEAEALFQTAQSQVAGAAQEAERVSQARLQEARLQEEALLAQARQESQRIIDQGREMALVERQQLLAGARGQVVTLAMETARRIAGAQSDPEHAQGLFQSLLEEVGDSDE